MKSHIRFREILGDSSLALPPEVTKPMAAEEREPDLEYHFSAQRQKYRLAVWSSV